jgi:putative addiction module component (TIGR02574 family)
MDANLNDEIKRLTIPERIILVEEIWDGIARENEAFNLSGAQKAEIERRSKSFPGGASRSRTWEEIRAEFLKP